VTFKKELAKLQDLADGVAIHGSGLSAELGAAAKQYVSRVEAYNRKVKPSKRSSGLAPLVVSYEEHNALLREQISLLQGNNRRLDTMIELLSQSVSVLRAPCSSATR
jgi:hypothetical protein